MFDHARTEWEQAGYTIAEHTQSPAVARGLLDAIVIHYPGHNGVNDNTAASLANSQRYYCDQRGYSLGYNAVVDRAGELWQVRGLDYQNAANLGANPSTVSVQIRANLGEPATPAAAARIRQFVADMRRWAGRPLTVLGHRDIKPTACPGDDIYSQLQSGLFNPSADRDLTMKLIDPPTRIYDTRKQGGRFKRGETRKIATGRRGAVFVNITSVGAVGSGYLTAWGAGPMPDCSILNYVDGVPNTIANSAWVPVAGDGTIQIYSYAECDVIVDLQAIAE